MDASSSLTKSISGNVLDLLGIKLLGHLQGHLHELVRGEPGPADLHINRRAHKLKLNTGLLGTGLLQADLVDSKVNLAVLIDGNHDDGLQAGEVDGLDDGATEKVKKDVLDLLVVWVLLPKMAAEHEARLDTDSTDGSLDGVDGQEIGYAEFDQVKDMGVKHTSKDKIVRALLGVGAEEGKRGIVAVGEELQGSLAGTTLERMKLITLSEHQSLGLLKSILQNTLVDGSNTHKDKYEISQDVVNHLAGGGSLDEHGLLGILHNLGLTVLQESVSTRSLGFTKSG